MGMAALTPLSTSGRLGGIQRDVSIDGPFCGQLSLGLLSGMNAGACKGHGAGSQGTEEGS